MSRSVWKLFHSTSLKQTLTRQLFLGLFLMLIVLIVIVHFSVKALTREFVQSRLQHDIDSLVAALTLTSDGEWMVEEERITAVYHRPYSGHYFIVRSDDVEFRSRSLWDIAVPGRPVQTALSGTAIVNVSKGPQNQVWLTMMMAVTKNDKPFDVWIAEDIQPLRRLQWRFEIGVISVFIFAIPLLLWVQKSIINRNFSIFAGIHRALKAMHEGDELRFPTEVPAEVADLVWEIEQTLQRSAKQLQRSRTAIGNLAHELKRPLQNLRWLSEHHHGEHSAELKLLYDQLQTLVIRELRRASISGTPTPGKRFQPNVDLPVLKTLLNRQHSRNVSLTLNVPDGAMPYDRDDMLELIGNLLDNAWRFAHTEIRLSIIQSSEQWILTVEDDGPGLAKDEYDVLSQRGVTRDESGSDHQGLGLHICQEVVASYSGRWSFQRSTLGGLAVRVELPVRP